MVFRPPVRRRRCASRAVRGSCVVAFSAWCSLLASAIAENAAPPASPTGAVAAAARAPLENLHRPSAAIYSGGEPRDDAAFSQLAAMGVRTVVSVDGVKPRVAAAARHGLRYVHIPIGYDGIAPPAQGALTRLVREAKGPVYIHCHHGKHRGPAAAAIACMAAGAMNRQEATAFLKLAGTGAEYAGLWRDVAAFTPLPEGARLPELVETAEVDSLAAAMAQLDRAWDDLQLCRAAGWNTPPGHADLTAEHQALLVWEGLRESQRAGAADDPQLAEWFREATQQAEQLHQSLQAARRDAADATFEHLQAACARCHEQYRN
ncbi:MAG: hypothetical protein DCC67_11245 [Planctomycetota bacterium]|nr:MAG: hypothetical protein DCC67_11245 [Planctomycetota bacterium]